MDGAGTQCQIQSDPRGPGPSYTSIWKNGLASPKGDLQICSEVGNSRGSVQGADCPLPALQRHS